MRTHPLHSLYPLGGRLGVWLFANTTVLSYDIRVASPAPREGLDAPVTAWKVHAVAYGAEAAGLGRSNRYATRKTFPLYGSAAAGGVKINLSAAWGQQMRDDGASSGDDMVSLDGRVERVREAWCGGDISPGPLGMAMAWACATKVKGYTEQVGFLKSRVASPSFKNLKEVRSWFETACEAARNFLELLDAGDDVACVVELSFSPHQLFAEGLTPQTSFLSAVELSLYIYEDKERTLGMHEPICTRGHYVVAAHQALTLAFQYMQECERAGVPEVTALEKVLGLMEIVELTGRIALAAHSIGFADGKTVAQEAIWRKAHKVYEKRRTEAARAAAAKAAATDASRARGTGAAPTVPSDGVEAEEEGAAGEEGGTNGDEEQVEEEARRGAGESRSGEGLRAIDLEGLAASALESEELAKLFNVTWLRAEVRRRGLPWRVPRTGGRKGRKFNKTELLAVLVRTPAHAGGVVGAEPDQPPLPGLSSYEFLRNLAVAQAAADTAAATAAAAAATATAAAAATAAATASDAAAPAGASEEAANAPVTNAPQRRGGGVATSRGGP